METTSLEEGWVNFLDYWDHDLDMLLPDLARLVRCAYYCGAAKAIELAAQGNYAALKLGMESYVKDIKK